MTVLYTHLFATSASVSPTVAGTPSPCVDLPETGDATLQKRQIRFLAAGVSSPPKAQTPAARVGNAKSVIVSYEK